MNIIGKDWMVFTIGEKIAILKVAAEENEERRELLKCGLKK